MVQPEELRELLDYDPETGVLKWLPRPEESFATLNAARVWNAKFAGKEAGCRITSPHGTQYIVIAVYNKAYKAHRIAWAIYYGKWPGNGIDHRGGDGTNNRIINLREADCVLNGRNRRRNRNNRSGVCGVSRVESRRRWQACIKANGVMHAIGYFTDLTEAAQARKAAEARFGGFTNRHGRVS